MCGGGGQGVQWWRALGTGSARARVRAPWAPWAHSRHYLKTLSRHSQDTLETLSKQTLYHKMKQAKQNKLPQTLEHITQNNIFAIGSRPR